MSEDLKAHVRNLLTERQAHLQLGDVLDGFPVDQINEDVGCPTPPGGCCGTCGLPSATSSTL